MAHRTSAELEVHLDHLRAAPPHVGTLEMVVRRPSAGAREILDEGVIDPVEGLVGDSWLRRARPRAVASGRHLESQINVMSARMVKLLAATADEQAMAGDQLYLDFDLSVSNLPAGSRLAIGDEVVLEISAKPHTGCKKFLVRFGDEAGTFVNSPAGTELRLRGLNARVVSGGLVRQGDKVRKL
jgi:hypothetical protein